MFNFLMIKMVFLYSKFKLNCFVKCCCKWKLLKVY